MQKNLILWGGVILLTALILGGVYAFFPASSVPPEGEVKTEPVSSSFNPATLSWTAKTQSAEWEARDSHAAFIFKGKMWFIGGLNGNDFVDCSSGECITRYWSAPHFNDVWSSSDGANWKREAEHATFPPRRSASIIEFKGKLWMFGGYAPNGGLQSDIWQSDDAINWVKMTNHAAFLAREGQSVEIWNGKLWMIGGVNYDKRKELNDVWSSDNGVDWVRVTENAGWSPRWDHDTEIFNGKMYIASGMNLTLTPMNDVWVTEDGINWTRLVEHAPWATRQGGALISHKGYLWIVGRLNDRDDGYGPNDVWYSSDGVNWKKTDTDPEWVGREDGAALLFKNHIYIFGGMGAVGEGVHWQNDVWVSSE